MNELAQKVNNLSPINFSDDEYDIPRKFGNAFDVGKEVADKLIECEKNNDVNGINNYQDLLRKCYKIFGGHFWGESYKKNLDVYIERKRTEKKT